MSLAFCWKLDKEKVKKGKLDPTKKPYKQVYIAGEYPIPVFEISQFPGIFVGTKREAKLHIEGQT